jgi:hypothetical protein
MTTQVFRPTPPKYGQYAAAAALVLLVTAVFAASNFAYALPAIVGGTAAALVLSGLFAVLFFRNTRVVVEPGAVSHTNAFGVTRRVADAAVSTSVLVNEFQVLLSVYTRSRRTDSQLFLIGPSGRTLLRLRSSIWGFDVLSAVYAGVPGSEHVEHGTMDAGTMSAAHPKSLGFFEENPIVVGVIAALLLVAVVVIVVVAVVARA